MHGAPQQLTEAESKAAQAELEAGNHEDSLQDRWSYQTRWDVDDPAKEPTLKAGLDMAKLKQWRKQLLMFLARAGAALQVHPWAIAVAAVLCFRFFTRRCMQNNDRFIVATACIHLAAKMEECAKPLRAVVRECRKLKIGKQPIGQDAKAEAAELAEFQECVLSAERAVLYTLGFDLRLKNPYTYLAKHAKVLGLLRSADDPNCDSHFRHFWQNVWNLTNDSFRTTLCLQYPPEKIGAAAFYLANVINMQQHQHKGDVMRLVQEYTGDSSTTLLTYFDITEQQLEDICDQIISVYEERHLSEAAKA